MIHELLQLTRPLVIYDVETTSKDESLARICSLGMRTWQPDGMVQAFHTLVNPTVTIPAAVTEAHGITDVMVATEPRFADLAERLYVEFSYVDFAGYNIKYDLRVTGAEFKRCGLEFDYSTAALIDAQRMWSLLEPRTLSHAVRHFLQRDLVNAHTAMADVEATEAVILNQLQHHPRSAELPRTVRELHDLSWPRKEGQIDSEYKFKFIDGVPCFNFGKWKNEPMHTRMSYLRWMVKKSSDFSPEVKRICLAALDGQYPIEPR